MTDLVWNVVALCFILVIIGCIVAVGTVYKYYKDCKEELKK